MSATNSPTSALPSRSGTQMTRSSRDSDDDAIFSEDTSEVTKLFAQRLQAWMHAAAYLEDYIVATEKVHASHHKEYEKVLKSVSKPLKEGHHFDQTLGGIAGFFDNLRSNTQGIANSHSETAKTIKGSVVPVFERMHKEIKAKNKELVKGAGKGSKAVDKSRNSSQKYIELLGQHTANFDSTGGKLSAADDPYVLQRGIRHRLNRQLIEENANRQDLLAVQNNFASFEAHIVQTLQGGLGQFNTIISKQADIVKSLYGDVIATAQRIPPDFEWNGFLKRNEGVLIDPNAEPRSIETVSFPNQSHRATIPLISGSLDRRGKVLRRYDTKYCVVTASKFLHEYETDDDFSKDPVPDISLFLPDCVVGQAVGDKFTIKGKDVSKSKIGVGIHASHDYNFRAHTAADAERWWEIIREAAGQVSDEKPPESVPGSPVSASTGEGEKFGTLNQPGHGHQETGTHHEPGTHTGTAAQPETGLAATAKAIEAGHPPPAASSTTAATDHATGVPSTATTTAAQAGSHTTGTAPTSHTGTHAPGAASGAQPTGVTTSAGPGENIATNPIKS